MNFLKNLYFLLVVLYSGMSISFFWSNEGLIFLWITGFFIFRKETLNLKRKVLASIALWVIYFIINTTIISSFHPFFLSTYIAKIMVAYWIIIFYKDKLFIQFEKTIFTLTILSLSFYTIQLIDANFLYALLKKVDLSNEIFPNKKYASIGIYTFHQIDEIEVFPRNAGFTWEPGPFSCFIMLAVFINIVRHNATFTDKKSLIIFLAALITTQSTTGFILLIVTMLWYSWTHVKSISLRITSLFTITIISIFLYINLPWLGDKIFSESQQDVQDVVALAVATGESHTPGRFSSFLIRMEDFINYPIAGFGGNPTLQFGYLGEGNVIHAVNGIGTILGKYGSIGFSIFLFLLLTSSKWISRYYSCNAHLIFPALIFIIGFSFGIIESPIIFTLLFFPVIITAATHNQNHLSIAHRRLKSRIRYY